MRPSPWLVLLGSLLLVATVPGCKRRRALSPEGIENTERFERLADRVCACTTAECATAALGEVREFARSTSDDGDVARARAAGRRIAECASQAGLDRSEERRVGKEGRY